MDTINIKVTATTLAELLPNFTYEACEALIDYFYDCGAENESFYLGDLAISFSEVPAGCEDEYEEERIIATLNNGNILVAN